MLDAIKEGNTDKIKRLLDAGFPINDPIQKTNNQTLLSYCAAYGDEVSF